MKPYQQHEQYEDIGNALTQLYTIPAMPSDKYCSKAIINADAIPHYSYHGVISH